MRSMAYLIRICVTLLSLFPMAHCNQVAVNKCCPQGKALDKISNECTPFSDSKSFIEMRGLNPTVPIDAPGRTIPINITITGVAKPKCTSQFERHVFRNGKESKTWLTVKEDLVTSRYEAEFDHSNFCVDHLDSDEGGVVALICNPCQEKQRRTKEKLVGNTCSLEKETRTTQCYHLIDLQPKFIYTDEDVDIKTYNIPENFDIHKVVEALTTGDGYAILKNVVSQEDVAKLSERVMYYTNNQKKQKLKSLEKLTPTDLQNHFDGIIWSLVNKGRIFEKLVLHPVIQNISRVLMGEHAQVLSYTANTIVPGQEGQTPHLDYPYYRSFFPTNEKYGQPMMAQNLAFVFITLITDFTVENGGTAVRPNSHKNPAYPKNKEEFFANAVQLTGKAGDVIVLGSSAQHCAMPNRSGQVRSGIILHMGPCYIRPYENIPGSLDQRVKNRASDEMKTVLGLVNPYPRLKD